MGLEIFWTDIAKYQLEDIFNYYLEVASKKVATKLSKEINSNVKLLINHPNLGPPEPSLAHRKNDYRYLRYGNYKII